MKTVFARKGCAGFVHGESSDDERASFCARCKRNRTSHTRRLRIVDGGKNEEGTMAATSEANVLAEEERLRGIAAAGEALRIAGMGDGAIVIYMNVPDAAHWSALKNLAGPSAKVRLIGTFQRVCESIEFHRADVTIKASGPTWEPSVADYNRMIDQRGEG